MINNTEISRDAFVTIRQELIHQYDLRPSEADEALNHLHDHIVENWPHVVPGSDT